MFIFGSSAMMSIWTWQKAEMNALITTSHAALRYSHTSQLQEIRSALARLQSNVSGVLIHDRISANSRENLQGCGFGLDYVKFLTQVFNARRFGTSMQ
jgi:hypothetical protein